MRLTGRMKLTIAGLIVGVLLLGAGVFTLAQTGTGGSPEAAGPRPLNPADFPHAVDAHPETNVIGNEGPPSSLIDACKSGAPDAGPYACKVALAMANGSLPPGKYSDKELQQRLQAASR